MESYGEEVYMGHISIGESGNFPSVFNDPLGLRGVHPAVPHMGSAYVHWQEGLPLTIDNGFMHEGYQTDKTQVYWLGARSSIPNRVQAAQDCAIDIQTRIAAGLKPGVRPADLWAASLKLTKNGGFEEGFMGLAIDEYPAIAKGFDLPLEEGTVLAIEPKIGIPGVGMVGVENTFVVTPRGGKSLTGEDFGIICATA